MKHKELETLRDYLDGQREHVLGILDGLSEEQLRRPVLPTGWSCLGLVRHLALDVELFCSPNTARRPSARTPCSRQPGSEHAHLSRSLPRGPSGYGRIGGCRTCGTSCCT
jgi:hypothetical protein